MPPFFIPMATVIPTLGENFFLTKTNVQLTYLLRTFSIFPANTIPFLNKNMPSLSDLAARYGSDVTVLCSRVQDAVVTLVKNTFPGGNPTVSVDYTTDDTTSAVTLTIKVVLDLNGNISDAAGRATLKNNRVTIPNDTVSTS